VTIPTATEICEKADHQTDVYQLRNGYAVIGRRPPPVKGRQGVPFEDRRLFLSKPMWRGAWTWGSNRPSIRWSPARCWRICIDQCDEEGKLTGGKRTRYCRIGTRPSAPEVSRILYVWLPVTAPCSLPAAGAAAPSSVRVIPLKGSPSWLTVVVTFPPPPVRAARAESQCAETAGECVFNGNLSMAV
jgi:hypothetical protein